MNTQSANISLYQKGNISLEDIYKKYNDFFLRYAGKTLNSDFYAEDVIQDVFIGLFQQTNYFVSEAAALKYIYRAIYNKCIDLVRHRQIIQRYEDIYGSELEKKIDKNEYNELQTKELFMIVKNRIDNLPPKCKQIFVMKYSGERSNPEISDALGLSLRTVENQIYIARNVLRKYIDSYLCS